MRNEDVIFPTLEACRAIINNNKRYAYPSERQIRVILDNVKKAFDSKATVDYRHDYTDGLAKDAGRHVEAIFVLEIILESTLDLITVESQHLPLLIVSGLRYHKSVLVWRRKLKMTYNP